MASQSEPSNVDPRGSLHSSFGSHKSFLHNFTYFISYKIRTHFSCCNKIPSFLDMMLGYWPPQGPAGRFVSFSSFVLSSFHIFIYDLIINYFLNFNNALATHECKNVVVSNLAELGEIDKYQHHDPITEVRSSYLACLTWDFVLCVYRSWNITDLILVYERYSDTNLLHLSHTWIGWNSNTSEKIAWHRY